MEIKTVKDYITSKNRFLATKNKKVCQEISNWMKKNLLDKYNFKKKVGNFPII